MGKSGHLGASLRRRRNSRGPRPGVLAGGAILILLGAAIGWWVLTSGGEPGDVGIAAIQPRPSASGAVGDSLAGGSDPSIPPLELPALGVSDTLVRELVSRLSTRPQWAAWLVSDELIRRFVASMIDLAAGSTPAANLPTLAPEDPFRVSQGGGVVLIDPASYARYDLLASTLTSLDTQGSVRLYRQLLPLIEEAYAELGIPGVTWEGTMTLAVRTLLQTEVPAGPIEVIPLDGVYEFRDPALEALRGGQKQLIRAGPANARLIQGKARELAQVLELPGL